MIRQTHTPTYKSSLTMTPSAPSNNSSKNLFEQKVSNFSDMAFARSQQTMLEPKTKSSTLVLQTPKKPPLGPEGHREKALTIIFKHFARKGIH